MRRERGSGNSRERKAGEEKGREGREEGGRRRGEREGERGEGRVKRGAEVCLIYSHILHIPSYTFIYPKQPLYTIMYPHILQDLRQKENEGRHETEEWL